MSNLNKRRFFSPRRIQNDLKVVVNIPQYYFAGDNLGRFLESPCFEFITVLYHKRLYHYYYYRQTCEWGWSNQDWLLINGRITEV